MLKIISTKELRIGMFVQQMQGAWFDHPFWRRSFLLNDPEDLNKLLASNIESVQIDTEKSLVEIKAEIIADACGDDSVAELKKIKTPKVRTPRVSAADEHQTAMQLIMSSKALVKRMFSDVRMGKALNAEDALPLVNEIVASVARNQGAITSLVRLKSKDNYTYMHSVAVCVLMVALARELGLNEEQIRQAGVAGLYHDVGKMAIPEEILIKPAALSDAEFVVMRKHSEFGHAILSRSKQMDDVCLDVCLHHHEKMDGTGYPHKMKGSEISIFAKMGAVCDVYDAITSDRPYKAGWEPGIALHRMAQWAGHFDPEILKAFVKCIGIYPIGSLVKLKSGRLAVVIDQSESSLLTPVVKVIFSTKSMMRIKPEVVHLAKIGGQDEILGHEDPRVWEISDLHSIWENGRDD
ncbi:MAG: HD-GYP domain-containing protein [Methylophilaceae bacterium]